MDTKETVQPPTFLQGFPDTADPPFCFRCGNRRSYCTCPEGPLAKSDWLAILYRPAK